jgi:glycosyltransferase involved in cell wall biosynthesis
VVNLLNWGRRQRDVPHKAVITYNLTEPPGLFTLIGCRLIGAKAVALVYDVNVPGETVPATLARRLDFWLQRRLIPRFDGLVVVNQRIIDDLAPHTPFVLVEGGLKAEVLKRYLDRPRPPQRADGPFTIVSVGSLNETNGFLELLDAFSLLTGDGYRLRIAGNGPLEGRIAQAAQADPRIEYCGYLDFEQILELYDTADVLVNMRLTQRLKTGYFFPSKTMEYLASGVPVITTCTGPSADEYAAIAFPLRDESAQALAQMIEHVASLSLEVRRQTGKAAQEYAQQRYTWERQGRRVADFVRSQVLGLGRSARLASR